MKKTVLLLTIFICFSFIKFEEKAIISYESIEITNSCPPNSSAISSSCWSGCVSVMPRLTGSLEVDIAIVNAGPRKPTAAEFMVAQEMLDDYCNS